MEPITPDKRPAGPNGGSDILVMALFGGTPALLGIQSLLGMGKMTPDQAIQFGIGSGRVFTDYLMYRGIQHLVEMFTR